MRAAILRITTVPIRKAIPMQAVSLITPSILMRTVILGTAMKAVYQIIPSVLISASMPKQTVSAIMISVTGRYLNIRRIMICLLSC